MNTLKIIAFTAILILSLSLIIMILFSIVFSNVIENNQNEFYHQIFPKDEKKIFIIGSSHSGHLNETHIQQTYVDHDSGYKIYNLARGSDTPKERIQYINDIVQSQPEIVFYGVGYRDFSDEVRKNKIVESVPFLPDPSYYFKEMITVTKELLGINSEDLESPQIIMRYFIHSMFKEGDKKYTSTEMFSTPTKPFYSYNPNQKIIQNDYELKEMLEENPFKLDSQNKNKQIMALKQILLKLKENNIKVALFTTPHTKYYINSLEESNKEDFDVTVKNISDEIVVPVYNFHYKYHDENIWYDNQHVVFGGADIIYNHDFGKIILQEIKK